MHILTWREDACLVLETPCTWKYRGSWKPHEVVPGLWVTGACFHVTLTREETKAHLIYIIRPQLMKFKPWNLTENLEKSPHNHILMMKVGKKCNSIWFLECLIHLRGWDTWKKKQSERAPIWWFTFRVAPTVSTGWNSRQVFHVSGCDPITWAISAAFGDQTWWEIGVGSQELELEIKIKCFNMGQTSPQAS